MTPTVKPEATSSSNNEIQEHKIVLVGDTKVGKTTIIKSLAGNSIVGRGYSVSLKVTRKNDDAFIGRIFDLRSQRYFPYLHSLFYNGAMGAIIVFDITNRDSFKSVKKWRDIIWGHSGNIPILICGNKSDLRNDAEDQVTISEAKELVRKLSGEHGNLIKYLEISALKNIIAASEIQKADVDTIEDIYPTTEAFRKEFVNWLIAIIKKE
ncbi:MAG: GTP-binding protein [Promethearchaeota archaeon]|nr:MAG: GTP-binding protein [Candidatus Lokiarchaeota archaeon]